jgi:hypothetical protein
MKQKIVDQGKDGKVINRLLNWGHLVVIKINKTKQLMKK